ncbi:MULTISPECIES: hypothetical protein [unclassified Nocardia]|uniref:hypothetical protein n=1 Tax=unclassified Nocardia TaxID=2637762 RepID=UPI0024A82A14|nr:MULTISPECIES: hypothetical protein [unclassified Nocardia]
MRSDSAVGRITSQSPPGYTSTAAPVRNAARALSGAAARVPYLRDVTHAGQGDQQVVGQLTVSIGDRVHHAFITTDVPARTQAKPGARTPGFDNQNREA